MVYMLIFIANLPAGWVGPVPYDLDECQRRADELNVTAEEWYQIDDIRIPRAFFVCTTRKPEGGLL